MSDDVGAPLTRRRHIGLLNAEDPSQLEPLIDLTRNTALRTLTLGVPAFRDLRFGAPFVRAVLANITSPVFEELSFALHVDAGQAEALFARGGWGQVVDVISRTTVQRVIFALNRSGNGYSDAMGVKTSRSSLQETVFPQFELLTGKGVEITVRLV